MMKRKRKTIGEGIEYIGEEDEEISTPSGTMIFVAAWGRVKGARTRMKSPSYSASIIRGTR